MPKEQILNGEASGFSQICCSLPYRIAGVISAESEFSMRFFCSSTKGLSQMASAQLSLGFSAYPNKKYEQETAVMLCQIVSQRLCLLARRIDVRTEFAA